MRFGRGFAAARGGAATGGRPPAAAGSTCAVMDPSYRNGPPKGRVGSKLGNWIERRRRARYRVLQEVAELDGHGACFDGLSMRAFFFAISGWANKILLSLSLSKAAPPLCNARSALRNPTWRTTLRSRPAPPAGARPGAGLLSSAPSEAPPR